MSGDAPLMGDLPLIAATRACEVAYAFCSQLHERDGGEPLGPISSTRKPFEVMAELIRHIGARATPDVLVQQLIIKGYRRRGPMRRTEEVAIRAFATVLADLDAYAAERKARIEAMQTAATAELPKPVPIEDTTMEPADGPMDTW